MHHLYDLLMTFIKNKGKNKPTIRNQCIFMDAHPDLFNLVETIVITIVYSDMYALRCCPTSSFLHFVRTLKSFTPSGGSKAIAPKFLKPGYGTRFRLVRIHKKSNQVGRSNVKPIRAI